MIFLQDIFFSQIDHFSGFVYACEILNQLVLNQDLALSFINHVHYSRGQTHLEIIQSYIDVICYPSNEIVFFERRPTYMYNFASEYHMQINSFNPPLNHTQIVNIYSGLRDLAVPIIELNGDHAMFPDFAPDPNNYQASVVQIFVDIREIIIDNFTHEAINNYVNADNADIEAIDEAANIDELNVPIAADETADLDHQNVNIENDPSVSASLYTINSPEYVNSSFYVGDGLDFIDDEDVYNITITTNNTSSTVVRRS